MVDSLLLGCMGTLDSRMMEVEDADVSGNTRAIAQGPEHSWWPKAQ